MPTYKLIYFNFRGRGETARLIMAYGGIKYEDVRLPFKEWPKVKPTIPFGQLPMLMVDDVKICQSLVINRFLAKKVGLHGKSDIDEAKIDMVVGCLDDMVSSLFLPIYYEKDKTRKAELSKIHQEFFDKELNKLEKVVEGDYFLGNNLSLADVNVADRLDAFGFVGIDNSLNEYPKLAGLVDRVKAQPEIAAWIAERPETPL